MCLLFQAGFDGHPIHVLHLRGRVAFLAIELGAAAGYEEDGQRFVDQLVREWAPSLEEDDDVAQLAEESGMPEARAQMLLPLLRQGDMSLDATYADRGPAIDRLGDNAGTPEDALLDARTTRGVREALDAALVVLNPRERRIVEARMIAEDPRTLEQLGAEMGVSKERVRQIEERARMKLRERLAAFAPGA